MKRRAEPRDVVASLASKLAEVRRSGKTCFGAESHSFELAPPASLAEVKAFERSRKITLPASYRRFVLEVGASGAGPFYGLMPLARWKEGLRVARKLGITAMTLTDQGCGNYSLLVLDGPRRGRVVYVSDLDGVYYPEDRDFAAWYRRWLDEILWDFDNVWFGVGMVGREPEFVAALTGVQATKRAAGAAAMRRLPTITKRSLAALIAAIRTDTPNVQVAAIAALAKHDSAALEPLLPALLDSRDKEVKLAALREVKDSPLANKLATYKDSAVAATAIYAGTLSETELAALLDGPAWESAIMMLRTRQDGSATPRLIELIEHADWNLRRAALVCLRLRKDTEAREALLARLPIEPDAELRAVIAEALGVVGDFESLLRLVRDGEALIRFRVAYALGERGDPRALPVLTEMTTDTCRPPGTAWSIGEQARKALEKLTR
ncbi:MAG: HEAT repeat domain-containing protein [Deltaproteobacteria bacterium]|nr:HEAT repeat domain-containing protein [Deltaproteobacteria bacterium]